MRITKTTVAAILALLLIGLAALSAAAQSDIDQHHDCAYCGMDRKAYGYSRMLVQFEDGGTVGVCSLHCVVMELKANRERAVKSILVADRDTRELIDAERAVWVIGGSKRGVMTERPKWAFLTKTAAEAFIGKYGGHIASWNEALGAARADAAGEMQ